MALRRIFCWHCEERIIGRLVPLERFPHCGQCPPWDIGCNDKHCAYCRSEAELRARLKRRQPQRTNKDTRGIAKGAVCEKLEGTILGIDLGTIRPSVAMVTLSRLRWSATVKHQSFAKVDKRVRPQVALAFLQTALSDFAAAGGKRVFIEDSSTTGFGKGERKVTNYRSSSLLTAQLHNLTGYAERLELEVEHIRPQSVGAALGFGSYPKTLTESQRRSEKKRRAKRWVEIHVDITGRLTADDADAVTIACAGWMRSKARRAA